MVAAAGVCYLATMGLLIRFICDSAHPHVDGGMDGVECERDRTVDFDHVEESCEDLFNFFRREGWLIAAQPGAGKPDRVLCPAHHKALVVEAHAS